MLNFGKRAFSKDSLDFPLLVSSLQTSKVVLEQMGASRVQIANHQRIHFSGSDLSNHLSTEISQVCTPIVLQSPQIEKFWSEHLNAVRLLLNKPCNTTLLKRLVKLDTIPLKNTQIDQFSPQERSLIIKRMLLHYIETLNSFKRLQNNRSRDQDIYRLLKETSKDISRVFSVFLNAHSRDFTKSTGLSDLIELSLFDLENIIEFYFHSQKSQRCIELISIMESKGYYISNKIWEFKIDLLSHSTIKSSMISNAKLFHGFNGEIIKSFQYPLHVNDASELLSRYEKSMKLDNKLYSIENINTNIIASFIRSFGKVGELEKVQEFVSHYWGISPTHNGGLTALKLNPLANTQPNVNLLFSILLAYTQNAQFSTGLKICLAFLQAQQFSKHDLVRFWHLTLKITGKLGDVISSREVEDPKSKFIIQYKLFETVWGICQAQLGESAVSSARSLQYMNLKYGSLDSILESLPTLHERAVSVKFNKNQTESLANKQVFRDVISQCVLTLVEDGKFLRANELIDSYIPIGGKSTNSDDLILREKLQTILKTHQDQYAIDKLKDSHSTDLLEDDDDFQLW